MTDTAQTPRPKLGRPRKHGHAHGAGTHTYHAWVTMKQNCTYHRAAGWPYIGAKGISFEPRWADFNEFLKDMGPAPTGTCLRRLDPEKDYLPGNVAWQPRKKRRE